METKNQTKQHKSSFFGLKLFIEKIKRYDVVFTLKEEENGNISGTYKGVKKMTQSNKKTSNQDIINLIVDMKKDIDKRFEDIDKRFEDMKKDIDKRFDGIDKRLDKIDAKIDLIIACPTIQSEIDHEALAKIDAR